MPEQGKVSKILNEGQPIRSGVSTKNNKPYSIFNVELEDGTEVQVFGPVKVGDLITEIAFNDQYNVTQGTVVRPDKHEEVMKALKFVAAQNKQILTQLSLLSGENSSGDEPPAATAPKPAPAKPKAPEPQQDEVAEVDEDEPINLDDIPF